VRACDCDDPHSQRRDPLASPSQPDSAHCNISAPNESHENNYQVLLDVIGGLCIIWILWLLGYGLLHELLYCYGYSCMLCLLLGCCYYYYIIIIIIIIIRDWNQLATRDGIKKSIRKKIDELVKQIGD
jgi:hypothetical protein